MNRLGIFGSNGRMGKAIVRCAYSFSEIHNVNEYSREADIKEFIHNSDFILDFSSSEGTKLLLNSLLAVSPKPLLIGTTALAEENKSIINQLSRTIPVMEAPNVSIGANLQAVIAEKLASILGKEYDPEIIDIHHKQKKDTPSGTALMLADSINAGFITAGIAKSRIIVDRSSQPERHSEEISIASLRAGNVIGSHSVNFFGLYDSLSISHKVDSRDLLAISALKAVLWLKNNKAGKYTIRDMIKF